ncbi:MAG: serine hydrolase [Actinobacteria bacterium]|nr:serine hydrolase [Actinomycetota bacterium]
MTGIPRSAVADAGRYFDRWLAFQQHHLRVPGVQAAVLHEGEVVLSTAHGVANVETGEELTERHLFRIASHSKTYTATCVMQLVEQGRLRLDDTVGQWLEPLRDSPVAGVLVRELLGHGGGVIRDGWDGDFWQLFHAFPDVDALVRIAGDRSAVIDRNERFKYSNVGYSLLGLVIEAASGQRYHDYVAEHVVARLGLSDTAPEFDPARADDYSAGHTALGYADRRLVIDHIDTGAMASATGFAATASDVVRYASAHFLGDDRLLGDDSKRVMQRTEWEVAGTGTEYGLGFAISTIGSRRMLGHGGGYPGHITRTFFDPVDRFAVSVLTNAIDGPALGMATALVRLVDLAVAGVDTDASPELDRFCGRFATLWGVYDIVALGGRLLQLDPSAPDPVAAPVRLEVIDDATLRIADTGGYGSYGEAFRFDFDADGSVTSVRGGSGSTAFPFDRFRAAAASHQGHVTLGGGLRV